MFDGLFNIFGGQNIKGYWYVVVLGNVCQVIVGVVCYIFKVCSFFVNYGFQCNYGVVFIVFCQCFGCQWQFIGVRYLYYGNIIIFYLINMCQGINCVIQQVVVDKLIEMCNSDGDMSVRGCNVSFNNVYIFFFRVYLVLQGGGFYYNNLSVVFFLMGEFMCLLYVGKYLG